MEPTNRQNQRYTTHRRPSALYQGASRPDGRQGSSSIQAAPREGQGQTSNQVQGEQSCGSCLTSLHSKLHSFNKGKRSSSTTTTKPADMSAHSAQRTTTPTSVASLSTTQWPRERSMLKVTTSATIVSSLGTQLPSAGQLTSARPAVATTTISFMKEAMLQLLNHLREQSMLLPQWIHQSQQAP